MYREQEKCLAGANITFMNYSLVTTYDIDKAAFEYIVGKGENAVKQHFLLFPQCFIPYQRQKLSFQQNKIYRLQMLSTWTRLEFCRLV